MKSTNVLIKTFLVFLFMPLIVPECLMVIYPYNVIMEVWQLIAYFLIVFILIYYIAKERKIPWSILSVALFFGVLFLISVFKCGDVVTYIFQSGRSLALFILFYYSIRDYCITFLKTLSQYLSVLVILNLIVKIICPNGIVTANYNAYGFLDIKNQLAPILILTITVVLLTSYVIYQKFTTYSLAIVAVCYINMLLVWSGTGIVALTVFIALLLFSRFKKWQSFFHIWTYLLIYLVVFLNIVIYQNQIRFAFVIENILHKSITFTGRTFLWTQAITKIKNNLLWGVGVQKHNEYFKLWGSIFSSHNQFLQFAVEGGLVTIAFFVLAIIICSVFLYRYRHHIVGKILSAAVFASLVSILTEVIGYVPYLFAILAICSGIRFIINVTVKPAHTL